jgi:hypothetical protein
MAADTPLRVYAIGAGIASAILSVAVGLSAELQMFGDGAIFAYSVAVADAWAFHWRNISGRLFSYVFVYIPAESVVAVTGSARAGIIVYGLLLFAAPGLSLAATRTLDRTQARTIFAFACLSTACLLPFVFGFPTEMAMAHAVFWPTLAACLDAPACRRRNAAIFGLMLALVLTHEGGVVLAAAIVAATSLRGFRAGSFGRTALAFLCAMAVWSVVKSLLPPDAHIAGVLGAAAYKFIAPGNLADPAFVLWATAIAAYAAIAFLSRRPIHSACIVSGALAVYWLAFDRSLLAEARYTLRTALLVGTPIFGAFAVVSAMSVESLHASPYARIVVPLRRLLARLDPRMLVGALAISLLVHGIETAKFVAGWIDYKAAVRTLATGADSDPELGDARFVSARRIAADTNRLAWNSTTPFLSVLAAPDFDPARLVVDPEAGYFWLSCPTATRSAERGTAIPSDARELVRRHACLNR